MNLPARRVIIKGTEIYDSKKGAFVDIGILDIMQIFGRAGRPQYDKEGEAFMICDQEKLNHFLALVTNQIPIESQFRDKLANNLNAEIVLGTVTNLKEAVSWLSYTYLFVRMVRNPHGYGLLPRDVAEDHLLLNPRKEWIQDAARQLTRAKVARYE